MEEGGVGGDQESVDVAGDVVGTHAIELWGRGRMSDMTRQAREGNMRDGERLAEVGESARVSER